MVLEELKVHASETEEAPEEETAGSNEEEEEEDEEELVDPMDTIRESCSDKSNCSAYNDKYKECNDRVNSRSKTDEICSEELMDYMHCVDQCMSKVLFSKLK